ncbi:hypothetical protein RTP6_000635 [Batrachochytrium dendrobatidis]
MRHSCVRCVTMQMCLLLKPAGQSLRLWQQHLFMLCRGFSRLWVTNYSRAAHLHLHLILSKASSCSINTFKASCELCVEMIQSTQWCFTNPILNVSCIPTYIALVLAPFFVFCEVLFDLGLFKKTRKRLEVKVVKAIRLMDHPKKA